MNLTFLKYFYDTGKEKSVVKSAAINFVSAPAISNGIKKLEQELGTELLNHGKNKIELTKEGIALLKACEDIFNLLEKTKREITFGGAEGTQHITVGLTNGLNQEFWPGFLLSFKKEFPSYQIAFKVGSPNQLKTWVQEKEIDFALTIARDEPRNYEFLPIHEGSFKFICHPKYRATKVEPQFILTGNWPEVESFKKAYFKKNRKMPNVSYEVESWGTIKNFVAMGLGLGIVPDYHLLKDNKSVKAYNFPLELNRYQILALFRKGTYLSEASFKLIDHFKKFIRAH